VRVLAVRLFLLSLFAAGTAAAIIDNLDAAGGSEPLDVHPSQTAEDPSEADAAVLYTRALDAMLPRPAASRPSAQPAATAAGPPARITSCGERARVFHAEAKSDWVDVRLDRGGCRLKLARRERGWRVIEDVDLVRNA
jgi:hypothetical protein